MYNPDKKNGGNVFYLLQYLQMLDEKNLLTFSCTRQRWDWDLIEILAQVSIDESFIDLITHRLENLPAQLQLVLTTATLLGVSSFDSETLFAASEATGNLSITNVEELVEALEAASEMGFLQRICSRKYTFAHDLIHESASSLLPRGQVLALLRRRVGIHLMTASIAGCVNNGHGDQYRNSTDFFRMLAVNQLQKSSDILALSDAERFTLAGVI